MKALTLLTAMLTFLAAWTCVAQVSERAPLWIYQVVGSDQIIYVDQPARATVYNPQDIRVYTGTKGNLESVRIANVREDHAGRDIQITFADGSKMLVRGKDPYILDPKRNLIKIKALPLTARDLAKLGIDASNPTASFGSCATLFGRRSRR